GLAVDSQRSQVAARNRQTDVGIGYQLMRLPALAGAASNDPRKSLVSGRTDPPNRFRRGLQRGSTSPTAISPSIFPTLIRRSVPIGHQVRCADHPAIRRIDSPASILSSSRGSPGYTSILEADGTANEHPSQTSWTWETPFS